MEKFLSIIVNSGHRDRLIPFLENINTTCHNKRHFEVCIMINEANKELENDILQHQKKYQFEIRYAKTNHGYEEGNKNSNIGIFQTSDKATYFIQVVSDRYRFANQDWDLFLKKYIGLVADDMFFLRTAQYSRNLKPRETIYGAFSFNETWGFYTRKMMEATGGFPQAIPSHDCGFEMLYYYIRLYTKNDKLVRDIAVPFLDERALVQSIQSDANHSTFYFRSALFFMGRCRFFNRKVIENLICQAKKFSLKLLMDNKNIHGEVICNEKKKFVAIKTNGKIIHKSSYKASLYEILKSKIEARKSNNHPESFLIDIFLITQFSWGRKFIQILLENIKTEKPSKKLNKFIAKITMKILCKIFIINPPEARPCLEILMNKDFIKGVLTNNEFKKNFKIYYKIFSPLIKISQ